MVKITIHSDGAARGNPGPAAAGAVLTGSDGKLLAEVSRYLGEMTNNQAEYRALILAVEEAERQGASELCIYADSELMVRQIKGEYRVKNEELKPLFQDVMRRLRAIGTFAIHHVPRERNKAADKLANRALDEMRA
jgi:ribonuclease HI